MVSCMRRCSSDGRQHREPFLTHLAVTDNADLIFQQRALDLILPKLAKVIKNLQEFALKYKDMPTLGFTHYQPVSMTENHHPVTHVC